MHDDMHALYIEYDLDLKDFLFSLAATNTQPDQPSEEDNINQKQSNELIVNGATEKKSKSDGKQRRKILPKSKGRPPKKRIKDIYRAIMKLCHPDKMKMEDLEEREYYKRRAALKICSDAYPKNDFEGLIFAASLVDVYVPGVSEKEYIENLNSLYSRYSNNIAKIQSSVEWAWGTNWDTLEYRYKIVAMLCISKGIALPEKLSVLEKLVAHETK